jgi:hypothetical protein
MIRFMFGFFESAVSTLNAHENARNVECGARHPIINHHYNRTHDTLVQNFVVHFPLFHKIFKAVSTLNTGTQHTLVDYQPKLASVSIKQATELDSICAIIDPPIKLIIVKQYCHLHNRW